MNRVLFCLSLLLAPSLCFAQTDVSRADQQPKPQFRPQVKKGIKTSHPTGPSRQMMGRAQSNLHSSVQPSSSVVPGTVRVRVLDGEQKPVQQAVVTLVVLSSTGERREIKSKTDEEGQLTFPDLVVGKGRAYRVLLSNQGFRFGSTPFRLPNDQGYEVILYKLQTTRDDRRVFLTRGQLTIELIDDRLLLRHVVQLVNMGGSAYLFPEKGLLVRLPEGYRNLQGSMAMGDQQISEAKDQGLLVKGSLMPGDSILSWDYELPISGSEERFEVFLPWRVIGFQVVADVGSGIALSVDKMPKPMVMEQQGHKLAVTEIKLDQSTSSIDRLQVRISQIPGPSPIRWIALILSAVILAIGTIVAVTQSATSTRRNPALLAQRERLIRRAVQLHTLLKSDKLSRKSYEQRHKAVLDEMTKLIFESKTAEFSHDSEA